MRNLADHLKNSVLLAALVSAPVAFAEEDADSEGSGDGAAEQLEADAQEDEYLKRSRWNRELLGMEQQANEQKAAVSNSKLTLKMLSALSIEGASLGSRVNIWHVNNLGPSFEVLAVEYAVDDRPVWVAKSGELGTQELRVHEQTLPPGPHNLTLKMTLRGTNKVFSYVNSYTFSVRGEYNFTIVDEKLTTLRVVTYESGLLTRWEKRPRVRYEERTEALRGN